MEQRSGLKFPKDRTPETMKRVLLQSDCNIPQSEKFRGRVKKEEGVRIVSVEVDGLSQNDDVMSIKSRLREKHIVSVKPKIDFMTGQCKGSAEVTVRLGAGESEQ